MIGSRTRTNDQEHLKRHRNQKWSSAVLEPRLLLAGDVGAAISSVAPADVQSIETTLADSEAIAQQASRNHDSHSTILFIDSEIESRDALLQAADASAEVVLLQKGATQSSRFHHT